MGRCHTGAHGLANVGIVTEVGGVHFVRRKFVALMQVIDAHEVKTLVMTHKDRLVRFGFAWFAQFCADHGCELLVWHEETPSPEQEMVQDLMTIVYRFSSRLYGLRHDRKTLKEALEDAAR